jgi:thiosulfate/3-mercaptopyruvate sulfurtransferase
MKSDQVLKVVNSGSAQICDARNAQRFYGDVPEPRAGLVSGHIPGSINIPFTTFVKGEDVTSFKSVAEIRDIIDDAGIVPGAKVINTCGSGLTAAITALSLYRVGWPLADVPIYDGSWSEWGQENHGGDVFPKFTKHLADVHVE